MTKVTVLIPAYNEESTIKEILERVNAQKVDGFEFEVIVVNDGSSDRTREILDANPQLYTKVIHQQNGGKGAAVRAGLEVATGEYVVFQDADLEYDPKEYAKLLFPVREFGADVVMGSRFLAPSYTRVAYLWHKVGNLVITGLFNLLNNTTFTDVYTCYLLFKRRLVSSGDLKTCGWEQHAEILGLAVRRSEIYYEVPIDYHGRTYGEGKKIRWYHIFGVLRTMWSVRVFRK